MTVDLNREPVRLRAGYVVGPVANPAANDYFNSDLRNIFQEEEIAPGDMESVTLQDGSAGPCRFMDQTNTDTQELDFSSLRLTADERLFVVAAIRCEEAKEASFRTFQIFGKIWLDGQLVYNHSGPFRCMLTPGIHTVVIELAELPKVRSLRISDTRCDLDACPELIEPYLQRWIHSKSAVVRPHAGQAGADSHRFQIMPCDFVRLARDTAVTVTVSGEWTGLPRRFTTTFGRVNRLELPEAHSRPEALPIVQLHMRYTDIDGLAHTAERAVLAQSPRPWLAAKRKRIAALTAAGQLAGDDELQLRMLVERSEALCGQESGGIGEEQLHQLIAILKRLDAACANAEAGLSYQRTLELLGAGDVHFRSELDGTVEYYSILLPERYGEEPERRYPLVVLLPVGRYELDADGLEERFRGQLTENAIVATLSCRGVTLGSYIGEAAFLEALEHVNARFRVDERRISLSGYSNGGYAAWAMAQAYPQRFASIAVYGGGAAPDKLRNLQHLGVMNVCGDSDFLLESAYTAPLEALRPYALKSILEPGSGHWDTLYFHHHPSAVNWLLSFSAPKEPQQLFYRTDKPHHRRIYWLEITRFARGHSFAEVEAVMIGFSRIELQIVHVEEIVLFVPERLHHRSFEVQVNGLTCGYFPPGTTQIRLQRQPEGPFAETTEGPSQPDADAHLSMGLLDIYRRPVVIVLPARYRSEREATLVRQAAEQYAQPHTASWDPDIYVRYPVVSADELSADDAARCNVIVFACDPDDHGWLSAVRSKLKVQLTVDGCRWEDHCRDAPYLVQFIQPNPLHPDNKLLVIAASQPELFVRNVFTRRLVIPSYASGVHGYLNKELIVYDGSLHAYNFAPSDKRSPNHFP